MKNMVRQYLEACRTLQEEPEPGLLEGVSAVLDPLEEGT
jgi:hypothetical protein